LGIWHVCGEWRAVCRGFGVETGVKFVGVDRRMILKCSEVIRMGMSGLDTADWDRDRWLFFVNKVMNFRVP
jgi:hypothetical protein